MTLLEIQNKIREFVGKGLTFADISHETGFSAYTAKKFYKDPDFRPPVNFFYRLENLIRRVDSGELLIMRGVKNGTMETYPEALKEHAHKYYKLSGFGSAIGADVKGLPTYVSENKLLADILYAESKIKYRLLELTREERKSCKFQFLDGMSMLEWIYMVIKIREDYAAKKGVPYLPLWSGEQMWRNTYGKLRERKAEQMSLMALQPKIKKDRSTEAARRRANLINLL